MQFQFLTSNGVVEMFNHRYDNAFATHDGYGLSMRNDKGESRWEWAHQIVMGNWTSYYKTQYGMLQILQLLSNINDVHKVDGGLLFHHW